MVIAVSSVGKKTCDLVDSRFGRCDYFQVIDTKDNSIRILENAGVVASGGAGIAAANQLINEKVDIVITGFLGPNAFDIIEQSTIKAYKCEKITVDEAIKEYNNNKLEEITQCKNK